MIINLDKTHLKKDVLLGSVVHVVEKKGHFIQIAVHHRLKKNQDKLNDIARVTHPVIGTPDY